MELIVLKYLFVFLFLTLTKCDITPCAGVFKSTVPCLEYIKQKLEDPNAYYFGNAYINTFGCSYQNATKILNFVTDRRNKCVNERPVDGSGTYLTLGSRLFLNNDYKSNQYLSKLAGVVDVQFISTPYVYYGCNSSAQLTTNSIANLYPGIYIPAVIARNPPSINFPICDATHLCTIIFFDAGHVVLHNVWVNWPKENNLSNFVHPGHGGLQPNPYVFLIYRQPGEIKGNTPAQPEMQFSIENFVKQYNLEGPIAINWMNIMTDLSAQTTLTNYGLGNNCASILENVINRETPKLQAELGLNFPIDLDAWMVAKFKTNEKTTWIDSLQNGFVSASDIKSRPDIYLQSDMFIPTKEDFKGQIFSLLLVQPSSVLNGGTEVTAYWFLLNIVDGEVATGVEMLSYQEPSRYNFLPNQFYLLLFKQQKSFDKTEIEKYFDSNCAAAKGNTPCQFRLASFVQNNQLTLSALVRFKIA